MDVLCADKTGTLTLQAHKHTVGFMGDGINDAPALHAADVGISVDTAVDIAKEAADMILLEKSLRVLDEGVIEGRKVFSNIIKYVRMGASSNFGNMFSVLGASVFVPMANMPVYCASKAGMHAFSMAIRVQLSKVGMKVFEVVPPMIDTALNPVGRAKRGGFTAGLGPRLSSQACSGQRDLSDCF
jgi:NAD(P)-dependent dehydrogenase (short-subunit alcohol dehydrogenase family)